MIAAQLKGGLGNQLFQYATARTLAIKKNAIPYLDLSLLLERDSKRGYLLGEFNIKAKTNIKYTDRWWFHNVELKKLQAFEENQGIRHLLPEDNVYLKGYWQNRFYFEEIRELLIAEIRLKEALATPMMSQIKQSVSVAVHVRRGDYAGDPLHEVCTPKYYHASVEHIRKKIRDPKFFIFSDDLDYCKTLFESSPDFVFVEEQDAVKSFMMMKRCRHFVLSNSSFSWWAQYLQREENMVTAPPVWFNDKAINTRGLYFPHWVIIETA